MSGAGELDRLVRIERHDVEVTSTGDHRPVISIVAQCWAKMMPNRGARDHDGGADHGVDRVTWRIRWRSGIDRTMSLVYRGEVFQIDDVRDLGRNRYLELATHAIEGRT